LTDGVGLVPEDLHELYETHEWRNASAVLAAAHPEEWEDLLAVLRAFRLKRSSIAVPGGRKSLVAQELDEAFHARDWVERSFQTAILVDEQRRDSPTHKVDCYKNRVGLELEWNNKTEFYDRDLNNFRLLFELRVIDVGIILTRTDDLQQVLDRLGRGKSYGASTTHMSKLLPKLEGGSGGGCPILVFGIKPVLYDGDA
jgi:hypothetical protein